MLVVAYSNNSVGYVFCIMIFLYKRHFGRNWKLLQWSNPQEELQRETLSPEDEERKRKKTPIEKQLHGFGECPKGRL